jgi:UDP-galactopyranose mutase
MPIKPLDSSSHEAPVVVVGAGPTGLSAAYHLGPDAVLIEQANRVGGWCRSIEDNGFTFDMAGHIMFSTDPYVHDMYQLLLGDNVHWQDREAWIYSKGVHTRYPFQGALYGLPPDVIKECIVGAIEARFGSLQAKKPAVDNGTNGDYTGPERRGMFEPLMKQTSGPAKARSYAGAERRLSALHRSSPRNFEEFIYKVWGAGIAKHFAIPYNQKLWAVPLSEMETSWLGGRVPLPNLEEMIEGALSPVPKPMGPNARFGYPLRGGFQALMNGFLPQLQGELRLETRVIAVSPSGHEVTLSDGTTLPYEYLISTMPLPALVRAIGAEAPATVRKAAAGLRHVSVRCVNLGIGREHLTEKHWIYYPEDTVFHRIFVQGNASPHCNPPGGFGITCEITYSEAKPLPCDGDALIQRCIEDCRRIGFFHQDDPIWAANQVDMPVAYVVYDHERARNVEAIREWLSSQDIVLAGRYAEWEYYNSDHAFVAGKKAAEQVAELRQGGRLVEPTATTMSLTAK